MSAFNVGDKITFDPGTDWHPTWQVGAQGEVTEITPHESAWGYDYRINLFGPDGQESGPFPVHAKELTAVVKHYFEVGEQFRYDRAYAAIPQDTVFTVTAVDGLVTATYDNGQAEAYFSDTAEVKSHTIPVKPERAPGGFAAGERVRLKYQQTRYGRDVHIILDEPHDDAEGWYWTLAPDSPETLRYGAKNGWDQVSEFERLEPVVTHRFKVGDVIAGQQGTGTRYTVLALLGDPETYTVTWATGYPTTWRINDRPDVVLVRHEDRKPQANLGLASTQELLDEIAARLAASENNGGK
jgi:hypothetical protein